MIFDIEKEITKANKAALVLISAGVAIGRRNQSSTVPTSQDARTIPVPPCTDAVAGH